MRLRIFKQLNLFIGTFNDLANPSRATCPDSKVHKAPVEILTATTHEAEKRFTHDADPFGWNGLFFIMKGDLGRSLVIFRVGIDNFEVKCLLQRKF